MYHKDYTIRLLQQFIVFLAKLVGLKTSKDPEVILIQLEDAYRQFTGFDARMIRSLTAESLIRLFSASGEPDYNRIVITASLLKEDASVHISIGNTSEAEQMIEKARILLLNCKEAVMAGELKEHYRKLHQELENRAGPDHSQN